jgi:hypothetical protein
MKRTLVVFGGLAVWPLVALAQTQTDPVEVPPRRSRRSARPPTFLLPKAGSRRGKPRSRLPVQTS